MGWHERTDWNYMDEQFVLSENVSWLPVARLLNARIGVENDAGSPTTGVIFLSHASQDAGPTARVLDADKGGPPSQYPLAPQGNPPKSRRARQPSKM